QVQNHRIHRLSAAQFHGLESIARSQYAISLAAQKFRTNHKSVIVAAKMQDCVSLSLTLRHGDLTFRRSPGGLSARDGPTSYCHCAGKSLCAILHIGQKRVTRAVPHRE